MSDQKLKIMIIDDELIILETLTMFLEDLGHEVLSSPIPFDCAVYNGLSCTCKETCPDVLLIDHHLAVNMKGLEFIERLKAGGCRGISKNILLMSGDTSSIDLDKALELNVTVVQKPMALEFLEGWLKETVTT